jgi:hypothetical protein
MMHPRKKWHPPHSLPRAGLLVCGVLLGALASAAPPPPLEQVAERMVSGGPPKDGIPSIDEPRFVSAREAERFLQDEDIVFGVNHGGVVRAYPRSVLVWHEVVNDTLGGTPVALTYCPLTGSAIGFLRTVGGEVTEFGTSGRLVNSNLVMYDRATDSLWPQVLGQAVSGPRKGTRLQTFPVVWTTWGRWKAAFPQTEVLSRKTGFLRSYGKDPYGSYQEAGGYYRSGGPLFPLMFQSELLAPKEVVLGLEEGGEALAVRKEALAREGLVLTRLGEEPVALIWDSRLQDAHAYRTGGRRLQWKDGQVVDERGARWSVWGGSDRGERLEPVTSYDVMWFAWHAFRPHTTVHRVASGKGA